MRSTSLFKSLVVAGVLALVPLAQAQVAVPQSFTFTGRLMNGSAPVNTAQNIKVAIFSGGSMKIWEHTFPSVPVENGLFSLQVGASGQPDLLSLRGAINPEVEVTVGGATLNPRLKLTSVPFAFKADEANLAEMANFATNATNATTAMNASQLNAQPASYYDAWRGSVCPNPQFAVGYQNGAIQCAFPPAPSTLTPGDGILISGNVISANLSNTTGGDLGTSTEVARLDHKHDNVYLSRSTNYDCGTGLMQKLDGSGPGCVGLAPPIGVNAANQLRIAPNGVSAGEVVLETFTGSATVTIPSNFNSATPFYVAPTIQVPLNTLGPGLRCTVTAEAQVTGASSATAPTGFGKPGLQIYVLDNNVQKMDSSNPTFFSQIVGSTNEVIATRAATVGWMAPPASSPIGCAVTLQNATQSAYAGGKIFCTVTWLCQ